MAFLGDFNNAKIEKNLSSRRSNQDICSSANKVFLVGNPITASDKWGIILYQIP